MNELIATCDPYVWIEEKYDGYVRYRNLDGKRWEVIGKCINLGYCYEGAVGDKPDLDCPVTPKFTGCCPFTINELEDGDKIILP